MSQQRTAEGAKLAPLLPALLDALVTTNTPVVIVGDRDGVIERWYTNRAAATLLGYTLDEIWEIPPVETLVVEHQTLVGNLSSAFRSGQPVPAAIELTAVHKNGRHVPIECAMARVSLGESDAYAILMREVGAPADTELSMLEADRISLVGALAAGFAHEINNPLTSVLLNLRSLRKQISAMPEPAQRQALRYLDDITTGAERIASNVRALQTLATRSSTQTVDLAAVVASALRLAAPTLEPRAHVIRQIVPVRPVTGEESRIGQAVLAMMLFSSSGFDGELGTTTANRIVVAVEERDPDIVVEVSDNGRDLTAEEVRGAFDPFFRSSARGAGVGVGLGVARSVATTLGGQVTLAPRPGGGAVITMRLPAA